jgi:hypothetical protein
MKRLLVNVLLIGVVLFVCARPAAATTVTITQTFNQFVGSSVNGTFDLSAALPGHTVTAATLYASFGDDNDRVLSSSYQIGVNAYQYNYTDSYESAALSISSGQISFVSSAYYSNFSDNTSSVVIGSYPCGNSGFPSYIPQYCPIYGLVGTRIATSGYGGGFSTGITLNAVSLADLADGSLAYTVSAQQGDFYLHHVKLEAQLEPLAVTVPENGGTLGMLALGLFAVVLAYCRRVLA